MIFHTVKGTESIFDIARRYSIFPSRIIEENDIDPQRLIPGEELLILTPTRTVSVRGGDTLSGICHRFGVRKQSLILANPRLLRDERIFPGQILSVKQQTPAFGTASSLGFYKRGCPIEKLSRVMPHLTYVAICSAEIKGEGVYHFFRDTEARGLTTKRGKLPLLGIKDTTGGGFLKDPSRRESVTEGMIAIAKSAYKGIYLELDPGAMAVPEVCELLLELRKRLLGCDLILFTGIAGEYSPIAADIPDGVILFPDTKDAARDFAAACESGRAMLSLDCEAVTDDGERMDIKSALDIAYRAGAVIDHSDDGCSFKYNKYKMGQRRECRVSFPSLPSTLELMKESSSLGYMGFAFDVSTVPISYLCMINAGFLRADYSLLSSADI